MVSFLYHSFSEGNGYFSITGDASRISEVWLGGPWFSKNVPMLQNVGSMIVISFLCVKSKYWSFWPQIIAKYCRHIQYFAGKLQGRALDAPCYYRHIKYPTRIVPRIHGTHVSHETFNLKGSITVAFTLHCNFSMHLMDLDKSKTL